MLADQLRQVIRRLSRAPLFTAITLLTLAIGIGANTVIFSVIEGVLLKPLPYPSPDRLIGVWNTAHGIHVDHLNMAPSLYFIDREQSTTLEDIGLYDGDSFDVTGTGQPEHVRGLDVTDGTLPLLGVRPAVGRLFTRADDTASAPKTILLSYAYWQRKFAGSPTAIGSALTIDGEPRTIIGVLPRGFHFLDYKDADIVTPFALDRSKIKLGNFSHRAIARLKPGVTMQQAQTDLARLLPVVKRSFPLPDGFSMDLFDKALLAPVLLPLKQDVVGDIAKILWVLMGSIALVLLVACANVANLLLVRVEGRRQELAIRSALGADRNRIAGELLLESLVIGITGGLLGLALAFVSLRVLVAAAPTGLPRIHEIGLDPWALLFTFGLAIFTSLLIGLLPVFKYARPAVSQTLREGGRGLSQGRERYRARQTLVVVQVALALVLLICSGLMIRTFQALTHVAPGFEDPDTIQTFRIYLPRSLYSDDQKDQLVQAYRQILDRVSAVPGVTSASISTGIPLDGNDNFDPVSAEDHPTRNGEVPPMRRFEHIVPGTFTALGNHLVAGRDITWAEIDQRRPVVLISADIAREYWGSPAAALGKRIRVTPLDDWNEIIGVAQPVYDSGVDQPASTTVYWPIIQNKFEGQKDQVSRFIGFIVRSPRAGSQSFVHDLQQAVWSVNSNIPLAEVSTLGELYTKSMARTSFTLVMLTVAGAMALLLGIIGIYGVISYSVSQRTREIGIRMALGAQRTTLTAMFVRQGMLLAAIGTVAGLALAFATMRLISSILFHVSPADPLTYTAISLGVLITTLIACYLPSRRAAAIEPMEALRAE